MKWDGILLCIFILKGQSSYGFIFSSSSLPSTADGRGGFNDGHTSYKSNRDKTLKCSCGILLDKSNAEENSPTGFPWHVVIKPSISSPTVNQNHCSGTIINDRIVLTSVKCILRWSMAELLDAVPRPLLFPEECVYDSEELRVWSQQDPAEGPGREISHVYFHPAYLSSKMFNRKLDYDIALLTLKEPILFDDSRKILPVCIPARPLKQEELVGREYQAVGSNGTVGLESFMYPQRRCRLNAKAHWISKRFLCILAPPLDKSRDIRPGSAVVKKTDNVFTLYGIHSSNNYFPMITNYKPLALSTNVAGFIEKIEAYSKEMDAKWCENGWNGLPSQRDARYDETFVNQMVENSANPWEDEGFPLGSRDIRKSCKCGRVNSQAWSASGRIQGGSEAPAYEYGWQVQLIALRNGTYGICGGSLINDRVVLTAAHCVYIAEPIPEELIRPDKLEVHVSRHKGPRMKDKESFLAMAEAVVPHPEYSMDKVANDVAVIILAKPLDFNSLRGKVSPICFPERNETLDIDGRDDAKIIGWGRTQVDKKGTHPETLQELQVNVVSDDECKDKVSYSKYKTFDFGRLLDGTRLCAGTFSTVDNYKDPGKGDSGGPLFMPITRNASTMIQIGVTSLISFPYLRSRNLTNAETVVVYSRTQAFVDFVDYYSLIAEATWCSR